MIHSEIFYWAVMTSPLWILVAALFSGAIFTAIDERYLSQKVGMVLLYYWLISLGVVGLVLLVHFTSFDSNISLAFWNLLWSGGWSTTFWICTALAGVISLFFSDNQIEVAKNALILLFWMIIISIVAWYSYEVLTLVGTAIIQ